ncbi:RNA polymerase-associated protein rtf1 [Dimargaris verticillata]|uniref:RNA polymerase-associated protein rtf1 n=1 Tax=Dimargaris verticillata TaxID=2761393 RepID=A0A9W8EBV8_9FUNG|nr:RNA polymerase-associated protein rtf1 [Dimargaris verticillata]
MDDELNDEILALYDGDSPREPSGASGQGRRTSRSHGESDLDVMDVVSDEDEFRGAAKRSERRRSNRHGSGDAMEVDERANFSSDDNLDEDQVDEYGPDLMGNEKDRQWLLSLPEIERESILSERSERRHYLLERLEIKRKLKEGQQHLQATEADKRRSARATKGASATTKSRGLSELKRRRERQLDARRSRRESQPGSDLSADEDGLMSLADQEARYTSASDFSDHEKPDRELRRRKAFGKRTEDTSPPATLVQLNKIRVTRNQLEKWIHSPFFAQTVAGCYVRVGLGYNNDRTQVYRIAEVVDVVEVPRTYLVNNSLTDKRLVLRHGRAKREFRMDIISNKPFTEREHERLVHALRTDRMPLVSTRHIEQKEQDLKAAHSYVLTNKEVEEIIERRKKFSNQPSNYVNQKAELLRQLDTAKQVDDLAEITRLETEIERISKLLSGTSYTNEKLVALAEINRRNRLLNQSEGRRSSGTPNSGSKAGGVSSGGSNGAALLTPLKPAPASVMTPSGVGRPPPTVTDEARLQAQAKQIQAVVDTLSPDALQALKTSQSMSRFDQHFASVDLGIPIDASKLLSGKP